MIYSLVIVEVTLADFFFFRMFVIVCVSRVGSLYEYYFDNKYTGVCLVAKLVILVSVTIHPAFSFI